MRIRVGLKALLAAMALVVEASRADQIPPFQMRFRVVTPLQEKGAPRERVRLRLAGLEQPLAAEGNEWSNFVLADRAFIAAVRRVYPNDSLPPSAPLAVRGRLSPEHTNRVVELEFRWGIPKEESPVPLHSAVPGRGESASLRASSETLPDRVMRFDLFGSSVLFLIERLEGGRYAFRSAAEYNRRYWPVFEAHAVRRDERPTRFPLADQFTIADHDRTVWEEGLTHLAKLGLTVLVLGHSPTAEKRAILLREGIRWTADGDHWPPGMGFDHDPTVTEDRIREWARQLAGRPLAAGFARRDTALFAIADEPAWGYPKRFRIIAETPAVLERFREYLRAQGLSPADVGAARWEDVFPIGRSQVKDRPSRRLFYWSVRFPSWDSARHYARCTRALEDAFYPGLPVYANWAHPNGRFYIPGAFGGNTEKESPDAAQGAHDWFEFARLRGTTMLWVEDWFGDSRAFQWSFYCSKLHSAAGRGGISFGGYIIPRVLGQRPEGILQKILTIVGKGGKAIRYFTFGPEYNFPRNCWSEKCDFLVPPMAEAHRMIARGEDWLWPGQPPHSPVAFVAPRSALPWDALDTRGAPIRDAANPRIDTKTVDYMVELFGLYVALQHQNVPVGWVDEEDLASANTLDGLRVIYLTEPDVPEEGLRGLCGWVERGGTLVTVSGAGMGDRYGEPSAVLSDFAGFAEKPRARLLIDSTRGLPIVGEGEGGEGTFTAYGVRGRLLEGGYRTLARFREGDPAIVEQTRGKGRILHYAWMPGISYWNTASEENDGLPIGFSDAIRTWIAMPLRMAGVVPPVRVNCPMIETPLLLSDRGAAITLLNWTGRLQERIEIRASVSFTPKAVHSVRHGPLDFLYEGNEIRCSLPLGSADIVLLER